MVYKQTVSGITRFIQGTLFLAISLVLVVSMQTDSFSVDGWRVKVLFLFVVLWFGFSFITDLDRYPTLSSNAVDSSVLEYSSDVSWKQMVQNYASGHVHTDIYLGSKIYSILSRTILIASVLSVIAYMVGTEYVAVLLAFYIIIPTLYAWNVAKSDGSTIEYRRNDRIKQGDFNLVVEELTGFFDIAYPKIRILKDSSDDLFVVKSLLTDSTLFMSPQTIQNLGGGDSNLDTADRFKLAHEFTHLSRGQKYTVYSQVGLIALTVSYYLCIELIQLSPPILVVVSTVFVLMVRLVINYIKRIEEFEADRLAAKFINASREDCVFSLVSVTDSDENPFTYPHDSLIGQIYTLFVPHPPIVSRIKNLLEDAD